MGQVTEDERRELSLSPTENQLESFCLQSFKKVFSGEIYSKNAIL